MGQQFSPEETIDLATKHPFFKVQFPDHMPMPDLVYTFFLSNLTVILNCFWKIVV